MMERRINEGAVDVAFRKAMGERDQFKGTLIKAISYYKNSWIYRYRAWKFEKNKGAPHPRLIDVEKT